MAAKWSIKVVFVSLMILSVGCRTSQPVLKPEKTAEVLRVAPQDARYESSAYPKQAYDSLNSKRLPVETKAGPPTRGGMSPGQGGMRGMGQ